MSDVDTEVVRGLDELEEKHVGVGVGPNSVGQNKTTDPVCDPFRIHPNLRSTVYCNAIAAGGAAEWNFAWEQFQTMTVASEAEKIRAALACTKQTWLLNRFAHLHPVQRANSIPASSSEHAVLFRYLEYTLNPSFIRKQDATSTITYIASNVVGQPLAWDFIRARWEYIFNE